MADVTLVADQDVLICSCLMSLSLLIEYRPDILILRRPHVCLEPLPLHRHRRSMRCPPQLAPDPRLLQPPPLALPPLHLPRRLHVLQARGPQARSETQSGLESVLRRRGVSDLPASLFFSYSVEGEDVADGSKRLVLSRRLRLQNSLHCCGFYNPMRTSFFLPLHSISIS